MAREKYRLYNDAGGNMQGKWSGIHSVGHVKHERGQEKWINTDEGVEAYRSRRKSSVSRNPESESRQAIEISQATGKKYKRRSGRRDDDDEGYDYNEENREYKKQKQNRGRKYKSGNGFDIMDLVF